MPPDTDAAIGYGSTVEISTNDGSTWVEIEGVGDITPPSITVDNPEAPSMQMANRTVPRVPGVARMGPTSFPIFFKAGSDADVLLRGLILGFSYFLIRETFPDGTYWQMEGLMAGYEPSVPVEGVKTANVSIDVTSSITVDSASAPTNTVKPAISGVAQVGQALTAWPGKWTGAPAFGYQWEADGTPIVGATNPTYTPIVGQIGDVITVVVTGTNGAGSASAESVGTAAVIAA